MKKMSMPSKFLIMKDSTKLRLTRRLLKRTRSLLQDYKEKQRKKLQRAQL